MPTVRYSRPDNKAINISIHNDQIRCSKGNPLWLPLNPNEYVGVTQLLTEQILVNVQVFFNNGEKEYQANLVHAIQSTNESSMFFFQ